MEITGEPGVLERVLELAASELQRMEAENDSWHGAYNSMKVLDGDAIGLRIRGIVQSLGTIPRSFPKGHWIVYLQPAIRRVGKITIMAFSKDKLALVYFGSVNDPD
jgi:hypothetical protein